jgi:MFS family permease
VDHPARSSRLKSSVGAPLSPWVLVPWRALFSRALAALSIGISLVELMAGAQSTVTATIMPAVALDLGGLQFYGLVFGAYFLASLAVTPVAGSAADRWGPSRPFGVAVVTFGVGTLLCGVAASMPMLVVFRAISGSGAGAQYVIAYGAIGKAYPEAARPRMLALLSAVWIIPGLLGPGFGSLVAGTVGWRWSFLSMLPIVAVALVLTMPALARLPAAERTRMSLDPRWPFALALGTGTALTALSSAQWQGLPIAGFGIAVGVLALHRVLPPGSLTARPGLGAAIASNFLANFGFWIGYGFFPLLITQVRGRSIAEGGLVVTLITVGWALGNWWQSRAVATISYRSLVVIGCATLCTGLAFSLTALVGVPLAVSYVAWLVAGLGMGVFFPTVQLVALRASSPGEETTAIAAVQVTTLLAAGAGAGIGGVSVAITQIMHTPLANGLAVAFAVGIGSAFAGAVVALRIGTRSSVKQTNVQKG